VKATLTDAARTVREAEATWLQIIFSSASFAPRGLYGGKLVLSQKDLSFTMSRYSDVAGIQVTGKVTFVLIVVFGLVVLIRSSLAPVGLARPALALADRSHL